MILKTFFRPLIPLHGNVAYNIKIKILSHRYFIIVNSWITYLQTSQYPSVPVKNVPKPTCVDSRVREVPRKVAIPIATPPPIPYIKLLRKHGICETSRPNTFSSCDFKIISVSKYRLFNIEMFYPSGFFFFNH